MTSVRWLLFPALFAPTLAIAAAKKPSGSPPSAREIRAYQSDWEDALELYRKGRFDRAVRKFEGLEAGDPLASLYRSVVLAGARLRAGDTAGADGALAAALGTARASDSVWAGHLHRLRLGTSAVLPAAARKEYLLSALRAPLSPADRAEALYRLLEFDSALVSRAERNDFLRQLVSSAPPGGRLEAAYRQWLALFPPADTAWAEQRLAFDFEEKLELWSAAIARAEASLALAPGPEAARALDEKIALWHYNKGSYSESIRRYSLYRARFGDAPEILLQLARAHRALGQDAQAQEWYSRLAGLFPADPRAAEILWMRAFDDEAQGRLGAASGTYARIMRDFPLHARSGEAMFRAGLVHYKRGDFAAARRGFAELGLAGRGGRLASAARYWEGKALERMGDAAAARAAWASLVREHPFGHYGHAARGEFVRRRALPDSLQWERLLHRAGEDSVKAWLAAAGGGAPPEGFGESPRLPVAKLFALGLDTLAVLTLQARVRAAPADPWTAYEAAVRCREAGFDYEAYRLALRLSDRLSPERRASMPVAVLRLFYPPSFGDLARPESERAGVPPSLVLALIKQESGFDPVAVSRAGARGLMQLMPVTGAEQARKEGMASFHPDSLFVPAVNVRLGVAYLRDVLRRHEGEAAFALAHYNAGPTALARWLPRLRDRPFEEMAEDIGYAETREYVKRVTANWRTYQVLWGEEESGKMKDER